MSLSVLYIVFDSGTTEVLFSYREKFVRGTLKNCSIHTAVLADKSCVVSYKSGEVVTVITYNLRFSIDFMVPYLGYNLASTGILADKGG